MSSELSKAITVRQNEQYEASNVIKPKINKKKD